MCCYWNRKSFRPRTNILDYADWILRAMAESRDDFIIAIRSAFLKKSTKQKFSLLTLALFSVLIISLSSFDFKIIRYLKIGINEFVYRSSFIVSIPENFVKNSFFEIKSYTSFFNDYKKKRWVRNFEIWLYF